VTHNGVSEDFNSGQITAGRSVFGGAENDWITVGLDTGATYVDAGEGNDSVFGAMLTTC